MACDWQQKGCKRNDKLKDIHWFSFEDSNVLFSPNNGSDIIFPCVSYWAGQVESVLLFCTQIYKWGIHCKNVGRKDFKSVQECVFCTFT